MLRSAIFVLVLLVAAEATAQDQASRQGTERRGYFGAPVLKYTAVRDQGTVMIGGRGGWNISPSLVLGGGLYGTLSQVDAPNEVLSAGAGLLDIKFESFGLELEYTPKPTAPTHLILGACLGGAANRYVKDETNDQDGETDFMLLAEPTVGVDWKVAEGARLHVAVSYRLVGGVEQRGLTGSDFNGPSAVIAVKLGRF